MFWIYQNVSGLRICSTELTEVMKKMKILICRILKAVYYRVYKCTAILHTLMGRTHGENSMSKLDNDAKRVANIYMELPKGGKSVVCGGSVVCTHKVHT